jgi:hypothetical protein
MLARCLNPHCGARFRHSQEGRIFTIEQVVAVPRAAEPQRVVEHYWLCGLCSMTLRVIVENGRVTTVPIRQELTAPETTEKVISVT